MALPRETKMEGYDTQGVPVRLGDTDSDGYPVGYIDPEGLAHESHYKAEQSRLEGRLFDLAKVVPSRGLAAVARVIAREECSPENREFATAEAFENLAFWLKVKSFPRHELFPFHLPLFVVDPKGKF